tara:strand:- start:1217 stop:1735 length:519 start_codon:yes stop_codon:yes gene_type:complete
MNLKKFFFKKTKSTNDEAIKKIKEGNEKGIIVSEKQSHGRGQYGKKWISIKGNLFISIFFKIKNDITIKNTSKLNFVILTKIISDLIKEKIEIKYPNDLIIKKKKICGILQEKITFDKKKYLIIGIGLNVENSPNIRNYPTTYLNKYMKKKVNKSFLLMKIKESYEKEIKLL